jgi:hypothetical protein
LLGWHRSRLPVVAWAGQQLGNGRHASDKYAGLVDLAKDCSRQFRRAGYALPVLIEMDGFAEIALARPLNVLRLAQQGNGSRQCAADEVAACSPRRVGLPAPEDLRVE